MKDIKVQIETLLHENAPDFEIAKILKKDIKIYFKTLEESFATSGGKDFLFKHTKKIDTLLQLVYKIAMRSMFGNYVPMKNSLPITLVALGSYGREQLCVYSDIDLMIVYKQSAGYNTKEMIEKILYILWDAGLKLGHRVHEINDLNEVSKTDITIKTSMIESRFIEGSKFLWTEIQNELNKIRHYEQEAYIEAKIDEMKKLHQKFPLTMEPNLKEGVGGFRNANLVYWIGNILYNVERIRDLPKTIITDEEYREFRIALEFLFRVRSALHLCTGKKEDSLRLELIPQIAHYLGYEDTRASHMKFAKKVTASLKVIKLFSTIWIDALANIESGTLIKPKSQNDSFESLLQQLCMVADNAFDAHPTFLRALSNLEMPIELHEKHYQILYNIFLQPHSYSVLQTLLDARLLHYTIPPLEHIINLPQFDGYHQYAVDIHTLKAIEHLENITDVTLQAIYNTLKEEERVLIKLLVLFHDAGKGREEEHAIVSVKLFDSFAPKLGISEEHLRIGKSIILYHNDMSNIAQREDLHSEQTILKFAAHFPSKLELDLIYLLTYADMNAVGKGIYNNFNKELLHTLYQQSCIAISHGEKLYETSKRLKKEENLKRNATFQSLPKTLQKKILNIPSDLFFIKYNLNKIINISQIAETLKNYYYKINNDEFLTIEIIRQNNLDLSYLLHKLARLNIVQMDIFKLFSDIKYFKIVFNETVDESELLLLEELIQNALKKTHQLHLKHPNIDKNDVIIDCNHSEEHAIMRLECADQKGLLSYIINVFDGFGIDICSSKIHTKMNRVNDLFLIQKNGNFCNNSDQIIKKLTES